jgi:hypothetical protein
LRIRTEDIAQYLSEILSLGKLKRFVRVGMRRNRLYLAVWGKACEAHKIYEYNRCPNLHAHVWFTLLGCSRIYLPQNTPTC